MDTHTHYKLITLVLFVYSYLNSVHAYVKILLRLLMQAISDENSPTHQRDPALLA